MRPLQATSRKDQRNLGKQSRAYELTWVHASVSSDGYLHRSGCPGAGMVRMRWRRGVAPGDELAVSSTSPSPSNFDPLALVRPSTR